MPSDPTLYLYTSLTAGSSHIITATSRLETILKANKLPFRAIDVATDDKARQLWGRRSKGKKLPGLVKYGEIVGDLEQIEEWNEYGELKMQINNFEDPDNFISEDNPAYSKPATQSSATTAVTTATTGTPKSSNTPHIQIKSPPAEEPTVDERITLALRLAGEEAASKAKDTKTAKTVAKPAESALEKAASSTEPPSSKPEAARTAEKPTRLDETVEERESKKPEGEQANPGRRKSVVPAAEIAGNPRRPSLVPEVAAVSSANFRAENAEALGLVEHHRGSIVSATSPEEMNSVRNEIRKSISEGPKGVIDALRGDLAEQREKEETVMTPSTIAEEEADALAPSKAEKKKSGTDKEIEETPQKQDPKDEVLAGASVQD
ncbi:hypothetical protein DTO164E3_6692 [Paecilomyces variotii]|nr:hypothetical protein DTO164E3_6692 [Paecilomyces variotii]KAJ9322783.1 hypothetical protein DTO027B3_6164 [Paecilomyces variotii]KAJ9337816.1 hypothetical protein DTO027B5_637 [Paecilomyces variotii]